MLNNFYEVFYQLKLPLFGLFLFMMYLSVYWSFVINFLNLKPYNNIQRVHQNEVSRLGGFAIYLFFVLASFLNFIDNIILINLLISAVPFVLLSLKEDLFHNTKPISRLIAMIISCLFFFYLNPINFPIIDVPFLGNIISLYPISIIFFTFSVLVVMNGMNLIDGMNGLFAFTSLSILFGLGFLSNIYNEIEIFNLCCIFSIPLVLFLFFNFPLGKLFIGDLGAYLYGFFISLLVIIFFGKYSHLLTWLAVLLLFYPCMELLFSYIRKIKNKQSPLDPDDKHIHTLLNKKFSSQLSFSKFSNPKTTLFLSILWLTPSLLITKVTSLLLIILCLILLILLYIRIYKFAR